eukprot:382348-Prorocentrum_minimum.AAC.1
MDCVVVRLRSLRCLAYTLRFAQLAAQLVVAHEAAFTFTFTFGHVWSRSRSVTFGRVRSRSVTFTFGHVHVRSCSRSVTFTFGHVHVLSHSRSRLVTLPFTTCSGWYLGAELTFGHVVLHRRRQLQRVPEL